MLQCVIGDVLATFGEHHTVDLTIGAWSNEINRLIDFRQGRTHGGDRPLQRRVSIDLSLLLGKVVGFVTPLLHVDIAEVRTRSLDQFDRPQMQAACAL